jgi:hypothetical protein
MAIPRSSPSRQASSPKLWHEAAFSWNVGYVTLHSTGGFNVVILVLTPWTHRVTCSNPLGIHGAALNYFFFVISGGCTIQHRSHLGSHHNCTYPVTDSRQLIGPAPSLTLLSIIERRLPNIASTFHKEGSGHGNPTSWR